MIAKIEGLAGGRACICQPRMLPGRLQNEWVVGIKKKSRFNVSVRQHIRLQNLVTTEESKDLLPEPSALRPQPRQLAWCAAVFRSKMIDAPVDVDDPVRPENADLDKQLGELR